MQNFGSDLAKLDISITLLFGKSNKSTYTHDEARKGKKTMNIRNCLTVEKMHATKFIVKNFYILKNHTLQQSFRRIAIPGTVIQFFDQLFFFFFVWILYSNSRICINFHVKQPLEIPFTFYIFLSEGTFERQKIHHSKSSAGPSIRLKILTDMILYENHISKMVNLRMTLNSVSIVMFRSCLFMVGEGECNNIVVKPMEHLLGICLFFRFW